MYNLHTTRIMKTSTSISILSGRTYMYLLLIINTACTQLDCEAMLEISHIFHSGLRQSLSISESEASQESNFLQYHHIAPLT